MPDLHTPKADIDAVSDAIHKMESELIDLDGLRETLDELVIEKGQTHGRPLCSHEALVYLCNQLRRTHRQLSGQWDVINKADWQRRRP